MSIIFYTICVVMGLIWMWQVPSVWYGGFIPIIAVSLMIVQDYYECKSIKQQNSREVKHDS